MSLRDCIYIKTCIYTFDREWIRENAKYILNFELAADSCFLNSLKNHGVQSFHFGKRTLQTSQEKPQITITFMPIISVCKVLTTTTY